jgi:lysophospholipase L1-like esterase
MQRPDTTAARPLPGSKKVIPVLIIWMIILGAGLVACELTVRSIQDLQLFTFPLQMISPYYSAYDDYKIYNRIFFEERPSFFTGWPIRPEFFDAETSAPRYIYKPNLTLSAKDGRLIVAGSGDVVYWSSNSHGLRGEDFPANKSPATIRIVCLGASTTEGIGYDNQTYPFFLQQELRQVYPDKKIEVVNAGHHAYKARDNLALLEHYILPLNPDLIIFYEASNDLNVTEFSSDLQESSCWHDGNCWLSDKPWGFRELYMNSALFRMLYDRFGGNPVPHPMTHSFDDTGTKSGALQYADTLYHIAVAAESANTTLVFTSFVTVAHDGLQVDPQNNPLLFNQIYKTYYPLTPGEMGRAYAHYNNQSRSVATRMNLTYYDLAAEFPKDPRYFPFDYIHMSPEGNRLFAHLLVQHLHNATIFI